MSYRMLWIAAAVLFVSACGSSDSSNNDLPPSPGNIEQQADRLQAKLQARGYEVARGSTKLFTIDDCQYAIEVLGNCMGNNPAAPYIMPTVPLWADEYVDEGLRGLLGPTQNDTWGTHRMDKREAVLVVGMLPPTGRYFGIQTYVFSRAGTLNPDDPVYQSSQADPFMHKVLFNVVPKSPSRVLAFASLGNSTNNVMIENQLGAAFNQQRAFIISTDAALAREMADALVNEGMTDRNGVFTEPVSPAVARLGIDAPSDDFMTLIRYALPENKDAGDAWREQRPIAVLRIRDKNANAVEPFPAPVYDPKTARSELGLADNLSSLVAAVKQQWGQPGAATVQFQSLQLAVDLIGQHCLNRPMDCLGDTQDTDYQAGPTLMPDDNTVIAVVGTLGTATGNATYTSLSVNWMTYLKAVAELSDPDLQGSASRYAGAVGNTDKFYVQYFARNCTGISHCLTITEDQVPKSEPIKIIQRNYVVPGSLRGEDPQQVLNPVSILLDGTQRPVSP